MCQKMFIMRVKEGGEKGEYSFFARNLENKQSLSVANYEKVG